MTAPTGTRPGRPATESGASTGRGEPPGGYVGTGALVRAGLRRDRVRIAAWIVGICVVALLSAASIKGLYPTEDELEAAAVPITGNAAVIAFNGPDQAVGTLGGRIMFEIATYTAVAVALMGAFMVGRQTRAEEESGRTELVRASVVGRHAPTTAALVIGGAMSVAVGLVLALGLLGMDLPAGGSWTFGAAVAALGVFFVALTAVVAQLSEHSRAVYGGVTAVVAVSYMLRAVGDVGGGELSWLSPIGWLHATRPFAGERLWALLLPVVGAAGSTALAFALESRRDVGAGLVPSRPGPPAAAGLLGLPAPRLPAGFALRLQRPSLIGWLVGLALLGAGFGSVGQDVEDFVADNETIGDVIARGSGADLIDLFFSTMLLLLALTAGGLAIQSALRLRSEETAGRAEPLLATPVSRGRWMASHLLIAFAGSALVIVASGFGLGLADAIIAGDAAQVPRLTVASLAQIPAVWVLVGVAVALFGWLPRLVALAWVVLAGSVVVGLLADVLDLPGWARDLSPFEHVPAVPAVAWSVPPLAILLAAAASLTAAGVAGFRRRDVG
ncbi:MAG: ABC transporter permease [Acidimicrobiia bacterium]